MADETETAFDYWVRTGDRVEEAAAELRGGRITQRDLELHSKRVLATADRSRAVSVIAMLHSAKLRHECDGELELAAVYKDTLEFCRDEIERVLAC